MATNTFDIQEGMEVFGSDGQKIGKVHEVYSDSSGTTESGTQAMSTADESESNTGGSGFDAGLGRVFGGDSAGSNHDATRDPMELREEYGTTAIENRTAGDTGYFTVSEGGILGIGAKELFVPFTAVETVAADGVVTLSYAKDDAGNRFDHKPDEADDSNSPDMPIV